MSKKFLSLFFISLFLPLFSLAGGCLDKSCSGNSNCGCERYRVDPGETITVFEHNLCQRITNQSGSPPTFIPTRTESEWNLFCTFRPFHITCSNCPISTLIPTPTATPIQTSTPCGGDFSFYIDPNPIFPCSDFAPRFSFVVSGLVGCEGYVAQFWEYLEPFFSWHRGGWYGVGKCTIGPHGGCKATIDVTVPKLPKRYDVEIYPPGTFFFAKGSGLMSKTTQLVISPEVPCISTCGKLNVSDCCGLFEGRYCTQDSYSKTLQWTRCYNISSGNCYARLGSCCTGHPDTVGCEKPLCAECVCKTLGYTYCCNEGWTSYCAAQAKNPICAPYCQCQ